jgi:hypothetical protein
MNCGGHAGVEQLEQRPTLPEPQHCVIRPLAALASPPASGHRNVGKGDSAMGRTSSGQ